MACLFVASGTVLETGVGLWLDAPLTVFWLIGLTNALNLLDNMDGLAGGVALVAAVAMAFGFGLAGLMAHAALSGALAGALLAFWAPTDIRRRSSWAMRAACFWGRHWPR